MSLSKFKQVRGFKLPKEIRDIINKQLDTFRYIKSYNVTNGVKVVVYKSAKGTNKIIKNMAFKINGKYQCILSCNIELGKSLEVVLYEHEGEQLCQ